MITVSEHVNKLVFRSLVKIHSCGDYGHSHRRGRGRVRALRGVQVGFPFVLLCFYLQSSAWTFDANLGTVERASPGGEVVLEGEDKNYLMTPDLFTLGVSRNLIQYNHGKSFRYVLVPLFILTNMVVEMFQNPPVFPETFSCT
jgi:hypothetical protein